MDITEVVQNYSYPFSTTRAEYEDLGGVKGMNVEVLVKITDRGF